MHVYTLMVNEYKNICLYIYMKIYENYMDAHGMSDNQHIDAPHIWKYMRLHMFDMYTYMQMGCN